MPSASTAGWIAQLVSLAALASFLGVVYVGTALVQAVYMLAGPLRPWLDAAFDQSATLRSVFAKGLSDDNKPALCTMDAPALIRHFGFECEEHTCTTEDGFVLGLQRIVTDLPTAGRSEQPPHEQHRRRRRRQRWMADRSWVRRTGTAGSSQLGHAQVIHGDDDNIVQVVDDDEEYDDDEELDGVDVDAHSITSGRATSLVSLSVSQLEVSSAEHPGSTRGSWKGMEVPSQQRPTRGTACSTSPSGRGSPVLVLHGLMQCSDAWLCAGKDSLPYMLARAGYDVWMGTNRGGKYSVKHLRFTPSDYEYWNWSLDELARLDVPAMVDHVLQSTGYSRLAIVGFSQGTAQVFAALSSSSRLAPRISAFAALSPAVAVKGIRPSFLATLISSDTRALFALLGHGECLGITCTFQRLMSAEAWVRFIDYALQWLFGWSSRNIHHDDKAVLYAHVFSHSSVKSVVHWFQTIRAGRFQMFDDRGSPSPDWPPPLYDTRVITCPIGAFIGGADTILDSERLPMVLPDSAYIYEDPAYEHLDFMWAADAPLTAFPAVLRFLGRHVATRSALPGGTISPARSIPAAAQASTLERAVRAVMQPQVSIASALAVAAAQRVLA